MSALEKIKAAYEKYEQTGNDKVSARRELVERIVEGKAEGLTHDKIAEILGVGSTAISNILARGK